MEPVQALVLAVVQGLTEFLPISSSAHLVLFSAGAGWTDQGVAFDAAVHLGTLAAILVYFRRELVATSRFRADLHQLGARRLAGLVLLASLPVLGIGFLGADWIDAHLRTLPVIATTTIGFAVALAAADWLGNRRRNLAQLGMGGALFVGLAQVLALMPGTSRAGVTITAALALGYTRSEAARFAFLLAIPVLAAAGGYSMLQVATGEARGFGWPLFLLSATVAGAVALATVSLFMRFVERVGMGPFVAYRLILGAALVIMMW